MNNGELASSRMEEYVAALEGRYQHGDDIHLAHPDVVSSITLGLDMGRQSFPWRLLVSSIRTSTCHGRYACSRTLTRVMSLGTMAG